jgi:hypothetical protein
VARTSSDNEEVKERDGYCCLYCGSSASDVHHIIPRSQFGKSNLEEQEDIRNKVCVCKKHHREIEEGKLVVAYHISDPDRPIIVSKKDYEILKKYSLVN